MNVRIVLLTVLVAVAGGAAWLLSHDNAEVVQTGPVILFAELASSADQVDGVTIENSEGIVFKADRKSGKWLARHLAAEQGFPVDTKALSTLISKLAQANIIERKTSKAKNYPKLGVENLAEQNAQSTLVTVTQGNQSWQALVGNIAKSQRGTFVRLPGNQASLLIDQVLRPPAASADWLTEKVLPFAADDLQQVELMRNAAAPLVLARVSAGEGSWQIDTSAGNQPPIRRDQLAYPGVVGQTVAELTAFRYLAVEPYNRTRFDALTQAGTVTFTLTDNTQVFAHISEVDELGQYRIWFDTDQPGAWLSDWIFVVSGYQGRAYLVDRPALLAQ